MQFINSMRYILTYLELSTTYIKTVNSRRISLKCRNNTITVCWNNAKYYIPCQTDKFNSIRMCYTSLLKYRKSYLTFHMEEDHMTESMRIRQWQRYSTSEYLSWRFSFCMDIMTSANWDKRVLWNIHLKNV